jgi:hypothetical protein
MKLQLEQMWRHVPPANHMLVSPRRRGPLRSASASFTRLSYTVSSVPAIPARATECEFREEE